MFGSWNVTNASVKAHSITSSYLKKNLGSKGELYIEAKHLSNFFENDEVLIYYTGTISHCYSNANTEQANITATIFDLYKKYQAQFYKNLDGLFCILVFDKKQNTLLLSNNRYQTTSLYYYASGEGFYFCKQIWQLKLFKDINFNIYYPSIRMFIANGFNQSDKTQIENLSKLLPTYQIEANTSSYKLNNHWSEEIPFDRRPLSSVQEALKEYENLYQLGIKRFIDSKNPSGTGTLLSGGHDTSWVTIQYSKIYKKPLKAFTVTFPGWAFNEENYARNIAEKFHAEFHPVEFNASHFDEIVNMIRGMEEPAVGVSLPLHILGQQASQHVDLMLGGDGGDTLWGEYFPVGEYHRHIRKFPEGLRRFFHTSALALAKTAGWERFWELEHVASLFQEPDFYVNFMRRLCTYRHFSNEYQQQMFASGKLEQVEYDHGIHQLNYDPKKDFNDFLIESKLFNAFYTYQSFQSTKTFEYFNMEFYLPTIQREVIRFITNLPSSWVNGGSTFHRLTNSKSINRRFHKLALSQYLKREEIYNRSFDIPWTMIFNQRKHLIDLLEARLIKRGWYNSEFIKNLFAEFRTQRQTDRELLQLRNHGYRIYTLLSLEVWATEFIDQQEKLVDSRVSKSQISIEEYLST